MSQRMVDFSHELLLLRHPFVLLERNKFPTRLSFWNGMKWSDRISGGSRRHSGARKSFVAYQPLVVTEPLKQSITYSFSKADKKHYVRYSPRQRPIYLVLKRFNGID